MRPSFCYSLIVSFSFLVPKPSNVIMTEMIYAIWNCPGVFPASFANRKTRFIKPTIFQTVVRKLRGQVSLVSIKSAFDMFQGYDFWDRIPNSHAKFKFEDAYLHNILLHMFYYEVLVSQFAFHVHDRLGLFFCLDLKSQFLFQNHPT